MRTVLTGRIDERERQTETETETETERELCWSLAQKKKLTKSVDNSLGERERWLSPMPRLLIPLILYRTP